MEEKQKVKKEALKKIIDAFKVADFAEEWNKYRRTTVKVISLAKNLFDTWNCKIEYIKYKKFLSIVNRMQRNYRVMKAKKKLAQQKSSAEMIGRAYKLYKIRQILFNAKRVIVAVTNCARKIMFKAFIARLHICKRVVDEVFENAWLEIENKIKGDSVKTVQRIWRGYASRLQSKEEVERLAMVK